MPNANLIEPAFYQAIVSAFEQVGAPIFSRVQGILTTQRRQAGNGKGVAIETVKKAWRDGWDAMHGGLPAPPIKNLFPQWLAPSERQELKPPAGRSPHLPPQPEPDPAVVSAFTETVPTQEAGIASAAAGPTDIAANGAPRYLHGDPMSAALVHIDENRVNAALNELAVLALQRKNLIGIGAVVEKFLGMFNQHAPGIMAKLIADMQSNDTVSARTLIDRLSEVTKIVKDLSLAFKVVQESQRLLVGMPQRIEEKRNTGEADEHSAAMGRMSKMLRVRTDGLRAYQGEQEGGVPIDVAFTESRAPESAPVAGESAAKESVEPANPASTNETATG